jgi:hypothetical protein
LFWARPRALAVEYCSEELLQRAIHNAAARKLLAAAMSIAAQTRRTLNPHTPGDTLVPVSTLSSSVYGAICFADGGSVPAVRHRQKSRVGSRLKHKRHRSRRTLRVSRLIALDQQVIAAAATRVAELREKLITAFPVKQGLPLPLTVQSVQKGTAVLRAAAELDTGRLLAPAQFAPTTKALVRSTSSHKRLATLTVFKSTWAARGGNPRLPTSQLYLRRQLKTKLFRKVALLRRTVQKYKPK